EPQPGDRGTAFHLRRDGQGPHQTYHGEVGRERSDAGGGNSYTSRHHPIVRNTIHRTQGNATNAVGKDSMVYGFALQLQPLLSQSGALEEHQRLIKDTRTAKTIFSVPWRLAWFRLAAASRGIHGGTYSVGWKNFNCSPGGGRVYTPIVRNPKRQSQMRRPGSEESRWTRCRLATRGQSVRRSRRVD